MPKLCLVPRFFASRVPRPGKRRCIIGRRTALEPLPVMGNAGEIGHFSLDGATAVGMNRGHDPHVPAVFTKPAKQGRLQEPHPQAEPRKCALVHHPVQHILLLEPKGCILSLIPLAEERDGLVVGPNHVEASVDGVGLAPLISVEPVVADLEVDGVIGAQPWEWVS